MFCRFCGNDINDDSVFCTYCGKPMAAPKDASGADNSFRRNAAKESSGEDVKKSRKKPFIIAALCAVALAGVFALPFLLSTDQQDASAPVQTPEPSRSANDYLDLAQEHMALKSYDEAIEAYSNAIQLGDRSVAPLMGRGEAYLALEQYESAILDFEQAIAVDASQPAAYLRVAEAHTARNDSIKAIEVLLRGKERTDDTGIGDELRATVAETYFDGLNYIGDASKCVLTSAQAMAYHDILMHLDADGLLGMIKAYTPWEYDAAYNVSNAVITDPEKMLEFMPTPTPRPAPRRTARPTPTPEPKGPEPVTFRNGRTHVTLWDAGDDGVPLLLIASQYDVISAAGEFVEKASAYRLYGLDGNSAVIRMSSHEEDRAAAYAEGTLGAMVLNGKAYITTTDVWDGAMGDFTRSLRLYPAEKGDVLEWSYMEYSSKYLRFAGDTDEDGAGGWLLDLEYVRSGKTDEPFADIESVYVQHSIGNRTITTDNSDVWTQRGGVWYAGWAAVRQAQSLGEILIIKEGYPSNAAYPLRTGAGFTGDPAQRCATIARALKSYADLIIS